MARLGGAPDRPRPLPRRVAFDDIGALLGDTFESTPFTIDRLESATFEQLTYFLPLTSDESSAEVADDIVEGFHALVLIDPLFNEHLRFDRMECFVLNYGVDTVRFASQMTNGRPLVFRMTVVDVIARGDGVVVVTDFTIGHDDAPKPGVAGFSRLYVARRARTQVHA